jgi:hypothetical protein
MAMLFVDLSEEGIAEKWPVFRDKLCLTRICWIKILKYTIQIVTKIDDLMA